MTKLSSWVLFTALVALPASGMAAYEGGDVKDGGTISGTVKFKGTAPAPKKLDVSKDCLLYTSPSPRDGLLSRMPSSA